MALANILLPLVDAEEEVEAAFAALGPTDDERLKRRAMAYGFAKSLRRAKVDARDDRELRFGDFGEYTLRYNSGNGRFEVLHATDVAVSIDSSRVMAYARDADAGFDGATPPTVAMRFEPVSVADAGHHYRNSPATSWRARRYEGGTERVVTYAMQATEDGPGNGTTLTLGTQWRAGEPFQEAVKFFAQGAFVSGQAGFLAQWAEWYYPLAVFDVTAFSQDVSFAKGCFGLDYTSWLGHISSSGYGELAEAVRLTESIVATALAPVQAPGSIMWQGYAWDTDDAVSRTAQAIFAFRPTSGATVGWDLVIRSKQPTAADRFFFRDDGRFTATKTNTGFDLSVLANATLQLANPDDVTGQTMFAFSFNGVAKGGLRGDATGSFNYHAPGAQAHQFYGSLGIATPLASISPSGVLIGGAAGAVASGKLHLHTPNTDYQITTATPAVRLNNSDVLGGNTVLAFSFGGTTRAGFRTDYLYNLSYNVSSGAYHQWYDSLDVTRPLMNASASGLLIGGAAGATASYPLDVLKTAVGTAQTVAAALRNTTAAANGAQQFSPMHSLQGRGWDASGTPASKAAEWATQVRPVQIAASPFRNELVWWSKYGTGGYVEQMALSDGFATSSVAAGALVAGAFGATFAYALQFPAALLQGVLTAGSGSYDDAWFYSYSQNTRPASHAHADALYSFRFRNANAATVLGDARLFGVGGFTATDRLAELNWHGRWVHENPEPFMDEFYGAIDARWTQSNSAGASVAISADANRTYGGWAKFTTNTTAVGAASMYVAGTQSNVSQKPHVVGKFACKDATDCVVEMGLKATGLFDAQGCYIRADPAGVFSATANANFVLVVKDGSGESVVDTGVAIDTNVHRFELVVESSSSVVLYVDGAAVVQRTTHIPTADLGLVVGIRTNSTTARAMYLDSIAHYQARQT